MDEMSIRSKLMRGLIAKAISIALKKKLGYSTNIQVNEFNAVVGEEKARVHINIDADMSKAELTRLLASVGL